MSHKLGKKKIIDTFYSLKAYRTVFGNIKLDTGEHSVVNRYNVLSRAEFMKKRNILLDCRQWLFSLNQNEFNYLINTEDLPGQCMACFQIPVITDDATSHRVKL